MSKGRSVKIGRSARTGRFMPVAKARAQKSTAIVQTLRRGKK